MDEAEEKLKHDLFEQAMKDNLTDEQRGEIKAYDQVIESIQSNLYADEWNIIPSRKANRVRREVLSQVQSMRARTLRKGMRV